MNENKIHPVKRDVASEQTKERTGTSAAVSSHQALMFNLISPHVLRRLAKRLTGGGKKYGSVQWRQGLNDAEYVADRFNHLFEHLCNFMESGNAEDDNLAGIMWAVHALMEVERLSPDGLANVVGISNLFGDSATAFHEAEMARRKKVA